MNSIKTNPFVSALAGIAFVLCAALFYLASKGGGKYDEAKAAFDESYGAVNVSEGLPLYPTAANRDGKRKALGEYRQAIGELSGLFDKYRPGPLEIVEPQEFTSRLKKANDEVTAAFAVAGSEMPGNFFLGFEEYSQKLANKEATGVLGYQLEGIRQAMLGLAAARPSQVIRIYREPIAEESGAAYLPAPTDVARDFAVELTFKGSEASAREFISHLGAKDSHYNVIRSVKIINGRDAPPKVSDAKFEASTPPADATEASDVFRDVFILPDAESGTAEPEPADGEAGAAAPAAPAEEPPAPAATAEVDTSRILAQVLGSEDVTVFVRFDITMFLPAKELPQP